jgi:HTH-type transcriptional regulator / antitoxin HigA
MMITSHRQYEVTKGQLARIQHALGEVRQHISCIGGDELAEIQADALASEVEVLSGQVQEYESLVSGNATTFDAATLEELPRVLIRARIAGRITTSELADRLQAEEKEVLQHESELYASVGCQYLARVADAIGVSVKQVAELKGSAGRIGAIRPSEVDWGRFPVNEMHQRGWFGTIGFRGSAAAARDNRADLAYAYVQEAMPHRQPAFLRQRTRVGSQADVYALWAWQCRVRLMAVSEEPDLPPYTQEAITSDWIRLLVRESAHDDGPARARQMLRGIGLPLIIEPHLRKTYLDGAVFFLPGGRPVIGMTLRYDRIDNFWFVLVHELVHIMEHLGKGDVSSIFDDLEASPDGLEEEVDREAGDLLIPPDEWEWSMVRYLRTEDSVRALADRLGIHPAIVAGRVRKESRDFVILNELVGSGEVKRLFDRAVPAE